tara:strand:+ start:5168 stop:5428 length:261 start_codon:yes stop_codon:yes gene_type:complete
MVADILIKHFAIALEADYETVENYYGHHIEIIEVQADIEYFAEVLADELQADYDGDLNEDDRAKFHYDLMFDSMSIAWEKMMEEEG